MPAYDADKRSLILPDNTRFYKTFYKQVLLASGSKIYRPIETRLIVVRHAPDKPLMGTYIWNDDSSVATLLTTPYRDGTPWKDKVMEVTVDEKKGLTRKYAVPARHRCEQCHMGGDDSSYVLGFTPLQLNRREFGGAGRDQPVQADELAQVSRLVTLGILTGVDAKHPLPKLEDYVEGDQKPNVHALRAQGYMVGNCSHCHNPNGFALSKADGTNKVTLDLRAGEIFKLTAFSSPSEDPTWPLVGEGQTVERSYIYHRVSAPLDQLGLSSSMPLHTAGGPDCRGVL